MDKTILRNCRKAKRSLAIGFIDYKKAYNKVPHSSLKETLKINGGRSRQHLPIIGSEHA